MPADTTPTAAVAEVLAALSARAYRHMTPWTAESFAATLNSPHTLLTHHADAFVLGQVIADEAEILALATDPAAQRQGAGRAALNAFHTAAEARGARRVLLDVAAANAPARAFYAKAGYTEIGRRPKYYRRGPDDFDDALVLSRDLP